MRKLTSYISQALFLVLVLPELEHVAFVWEERKDLVGEEKD